jgi:hypothetical protein
VPVPWAPVPPLLIAIGVAGLPTRANPAAGHFTDGEIRRNRGGFQRLDTFVQG